MATAAAPNATDRRTTALTPRSLGCAALGAWFAIVAIVYYRRFWALAAAGPSAWVPDGGMHALMPALAVWALGAALVLLLLWVLVLRRPSDWPARTWRLRRRLALLAFALPLGLFALAWPRPVDGELLPWLGEAALRNAFALAGAALTAFAAYSCGAVLLRLLRWRADDAWDRLLFRLAVGFGVVSYASLALAVLGWYRPAVVGALLLAAVLGGVAWLGRSGIGQLQRGRATDHDRSRRGETGPVRGADLAWMSVVGVGLLLALVSALAPETEFDALWYHLWLPSVWLQHGGAVDIPHEFISLYPMTWELVFGAGLVTGGAVGAKLLHFICLPLLALAAWRFARRFLPASSPWLAAAIVVTVPTVMWESTTAYVDVALALYVTLGLYALLAHIETSDRRWFAVAVVCLGLAAAIKHLGLVVLAIAAAGLFVHLLGSATPLLTRARRPGSLARAGLAALALLTGGVLFGVPWYLRSWLASGNPFFPEMYALFGAWPVERWDSLSEAGISAFKSRFGLERTPLNLLLLPWNVTIHQGRFGGALGPVFLAALPLIAWRANSSTAARWLAWLVVAYLAVWASPISSFQLRFLVPIVPALALLASDGIGALGARLRSRLASAALSAATAVVLLLNLPPFLPLHEGDRDGWDGWLTHVTRHVPLRVVIGRESEDAYLRERVPTYGAWQHAKTLPANARVLEFGGGDNYYATREKLTMDAVIARGAWASGEGAAERAGAAMATHGITHVLIDRSLMPSLARDGVALVSPAFKPRLHVEYEDARAVLYRFEGAQAQGASRNRRR